MSNPQPSGVPPRLVIPFSNIRCGDKIASGSCGAVFAGTLLDTNEVVAIKELTGPEAMSACERECDKHMKLHHRNVIRVCGVSEDRERDRAYIITELAPRGSLADALASHPLRNDWATLVRWALDIANGLQYVHSCNPPVLHLDLKPQNVLLFDDDTAKLCDFGIAHIVKHTRTFQTAKQYTPQYAAPEQFEQEPISEATDVYAFGGVLFKMITKQDPWDGLTMFQIVRVLATGKPLELPSPLPNECPERLAAIAQRCLQLDPQRRAKLSSVIEDLTQVRSDLCSQHPPRIVAQQFARDRLPPDGWLADYSVPDCSLEEVLLQFAECPAPPGRTDLSKWEKPTLEAIADEYSRVAYLIPRSKFGSDKDHEDAMAVGLYTDESFVYWLTNAWANDVSAEREHGLRHVGPFMWRLVEALPRCCARYTGEAVRVLKACSDSPQVMRDAFADYERQLAEGSVLNFRGFASFSRGSKANSGFIWGESIVLYCRAIDAFDVDQHSMVRLTGGHTEQEVLCLPSRSFRVSRPPTQAELVVTVHIDMHLAGSNAQATEQPRCVAPSSVLPQVGRDQELLHAATAAAINVLLVGEQGTGKMSIVKEVVSRYTLMSEASSSEGVLQRIVITPHGVISLNKCPRPDKESQGKKSLKIMLCHAKLLGHLHAVLLVVNEFDPRFDVSMKAFVKGLVDLAGAQILGVVGVVFTHASGFKTPEEARCKTEEISRIVAAPHCLPFWQLECFPSELANIGIDAVRIAKLENSTKIAIGDMLQWVASRTPIIVSTVQGQNPARPANAAR